MRENTAKQFPAGRKVLVSEPLSPPAELNGIVEEVTSAGRVVALKELFGCMTAVEFDAKLLVST